MYYSADGKAIGTWKKGKTEERKGGLEAQEFERQIKEILTPKFKIKQNKDNSMSAYQTNSIIENTKYKSNI